MGSEATWQSFAAQHIIDDQKVQQFQHYYQLLQTWNERMNLTRITSLSDVLLYHFTDSLMLAQACDLSTYMSLADVGAGAGFPGIPLKIMYPHLALVLIEVIEKKRRFLQTIVDELGLSDVTIDAHDWRTFLRNTDYSTDLVCARASIQPDELVRMFSPASVYRHAQAVYWASAAWQPTVKVHPYVQREYPYSVGEKERKLVFCAAS